MCKVISILNQKGGTGKTTLATNLAYSFAIENKKVLLVDSDPQGSSLDWAEANEGKFVTVIGLATKNLPVELKALKNSFDWVIIDGAPQTKDLAVAGIVSADFVLIPVQPSPYDIWACEDIVELIRHRQEISNGKPSCAFVVTRVIQNTRMSKECFTYLDKFGFPVLKNHTCQRILYAESAKGGGTVFEETLNPAMREILAIKEEIKEHVHTNTIEAKDS